MNPALDNDFPATSILHTIEMESFDYLYSVLGSGVWRLVSTSLAAGVAAHVAIGYSNIEFE